MVSINHTPYLIVTIYNVYIYYNDLKEKEEQFEMNTHKDTVRLTSIGSPSSLLT